MKKLKYSYGVFTINYSGESFLEKDGFELEQLAIEWAIDVLNEKFYIQKVYKPKTATK